MDADERLFSVLTLMLAVTEQAILEVDKSGTPDEDTRLALAEMAARLQRVIGSSRVASTSRAGANSDG